MLIPPFRITVTEIGPLKATKIFRGEGNRKGEMLRRVVVLAALIMLLATIPSLAAPDTEVPRMTKEELKSLLGNRDLVIFDVRTPADYNTSTTKIKGAVRINPKAPVQTWMDKYTKNKIYVFYCR